MNPVELEHIWVNALLGGLVVAFLTWAGVVWKASRTLGEKFDRMRESFHRYSVDVEHRLTVIEERLVHMCGSDKNPPGQ